MPPVCALTHSAPVTGESHSVQHSAQIIAVKSHADSPHKHRAFTHTTTQSHVADTHTHTNAHCARRGGPLIYVVVNYN